MTIISILLTVAFIFSTSSLIRLKKELEIAEDEINFNNAVIKMQNKNIEKYLNDLQVEYTKKRAERQESNL